MRLFFIVFFTLMQCCPLLWAQSNLKTEADLKKQAEKSFQSKDYQIASGLFSELLSLSPKNGEYNYKYGVCALYTEKDKSKSLRYLEIACKTPGVEEDAFFYLGKSYHINYRFDEGVAVLEKYKKSARQADIARQDVDHLIRMCQNGKKVFTESVSLDVVEQKELPLSALYSGYELKALGGKILATPKEFKTKIDVKKAENSTIYLSKENFAVFYSSYGEHDDNSKDIYKVIQLPTTEWSKPENLGGVINTKYTEDYPFICADGKTLYFSSEGHNSMGGLDIFRSVYDENSKTWSAPENLGYPINSTGDDVFYASGLAEPEFAWFASNRETTQSRMMVYKIRVKKSLSSFVSIKGKFSSLDRRDLKVAKIAIFNVDNNELLGTYLSNPSSADYLIKVTPGATYTFVVEADGYLPHSENISIPALSSSVLTMYQEIKLKKDSTGEEMIVKNTFVDNNQAPSENLKPQEVTSKFVYDADYKDKLKPVEIDGQIIYVTPPTHFTENQVATAKDSSIKKSDFKGTISNNDLVKIAYEDAQESETEALALKKDADIATGIATERDSIAKEMGKQAQLAMADAQKVKNPAEKQEALKKATQLEEESNKMTKESEVASEMSRQLSEQAHAKKMEADSAFADAKALDATVSGKNGNALALQSNVKRKKRNHVKTHSPVVTGDAATLAIASSISKEVENKRDSTSQSAGATPLVSIKNDAQSEVPLAGVQPLATVDAPLVSIQSAPKVDESLVIIQPATKVDSNLAGNHPSPKDETPVNAIQSVVKDEAILKNPQIVSSVPDSSKIIKIVAVEAEKPVVKTDSFQVAQSLEVSNKPVSDKPMETGSNETKANSVIKTDSIKASHLVEVEKKLVAKTPSDSIQEVIPEKHDAENLAMIINDPDYKKYSALDSVSEAKKRRATEIRGEAELRRSEATADAAAAHTLEELMPSVKRKKEKKIKQAEIEALNKQALNKNSIADSLTLVATTTDEDAKKDARQASALKLNMEAKNAIASSVKQAQQADLLAAESRHDADAAQLLKKSDKKIKNKKLRDQNLVKSTTLAQGSRRKQQAADSLIANANALRLGATAKQQQAQLIYTEPTVSLNKASKSADTISSGVTTSEPGVSVVSKVSSDSTAKIASSAIMQRDTVDSHKLVTADTVVAPLVATTKTDTVATTNTAEARVNVSGPEVIQRKQEAEENYTQALKFEKEAKNDSAKAEGFRALAAMAGISPVQKIEAEHEAHLSDSLSVNNKQRADKLFLAARGLPVANQPAQTLAENKQVPTIADTKPNNISTETKQIQTIAQNKVDQTVSGSKNDQATTQNKQVPGTTEIKEVQTSTENKQVETVTGDKQVQTIAENKQVEAITQNKEIHTVAESKPVQGSAENKSNQPGSETKPGQVTPDTKLNQVNSENKSDQILSGTKVDPDNQAAQPGQNVAEISGQTTSIFVASEQSVYNEANPIPLNPALPEGLVFKVQIGAFRNAIPQNTFKGIQPITGEKTVNGLTRYSAGLFVAFESANLVKKEIRSLGYRDAFVVAFYKGKRIPINEAADVVNNYSELQKKVRQDVIAEELKVLKNNNIYADKYAQTDVDLAVNTNTNRQVEGQKKSGDNPSITDKSLKYDGLIYTVQVGVYKRLEPPRRLRSMSNLNRDELVNGLYRFTSGVFNYYNAAEKHRMLVAHNVPDAFVIPLFKGQRITDVEAKRLERLNPPVKIEDPVTVTDLKKGTVVAGNLRFKVQVGAFKLQVPVEIIDKLLKIQGGQLKNLKRNDLTIFYLGEEEKLSSAEALQEEAIKAGITDAFIVAFYGENQVSMQEARDILKNRP